MASGPQAPPCIDAAPAEPTGSVGFGPAELAPSCVHLVGSGVLADSSQPVVLGLQKVWEQSWGHAAERAVRADSPRSEMRTQLPAAAKDG